MEKNIAQINLDDIYIEVKKVNMRLESIEKALETFLDMILPEEEIDEIEEEIERGEHMLFEELKEKHGVK